MTLRLADMPDWPAMLTREQAAAYVGVGVEIFDQEVADGLWPPGLRRGKKKGKVTWARAEIDRRISGGPLDGTDETGFDQRRAAAAAAWREAQEGPKRPGLPLSGNRRGPRAA